MIIVYPATATGTDFDYNGLAVLNECLQAPITHELNGDFSLTLEYPADSPKAEHLKEWNIIKADGQLFRINTVKKVDDGIKTISVWARHVFYDADREYILDVRAVDQTMQQALEKTLVDGLSTKFTISTDITDTNTIYYIKQNPTQAIFRTIERWGKGELRRDNFNISVLKSIGLDDGHLISYRKNIRGFEQELDVSQMATRLVPIGKDGLTIEFSNNGSQYITSPIAGNYPFVITNEVVYSEIDSSSQLKAMAETNWGIIDYPRVSYRVDFEELSLTEEYKNYAHLRKVQLGDTVLVKHEPFNIDLKTKVIRVVKDAITGRVIEVILGNFQPTIAESMNNWQGQMSNDITRVETELLSAQKSNNLKFEQTSTELSMKASTEELGNTNTRVTDVEFKVQPDNIVSAVRGSEQYVADLGDKADQTSLDETNTNLGGLVSRIESAESSITQNTNEILLRVTKTQVDESINAITIGGRNLITRSTETPNRLITTDGSLSASANHATTDYMSVVAGETLTFSKTDSSLAGDGGFFRWAWYNDAKVYISRKADRLNEFQWEVPNGVSHIRVSYPVDALPKVERGNKATDWTPSPEDVQAEIGGVRGSFDDFVASVYTPTIQDIQNQVDGSITTWFYDGEPTLTNAPAVDWTTNDIKNVHLGDLYYDNLTGYAYRFKLNGATYEWLKITDTDVTKALQDAHKAQDTADGKRRVFVTTPTSPYDVGDLWTQGVTGDLMRCKTAKASGSAYNSADWEKASKYTDDTAANNLNTNEIQPLKARVSTAESSITQQAGEIALRVTQSVYEGGLATKENNIIKQNTAPTHGAGKLWLDTSVTPNVLKRSTGTAWVKATPTTAGEVGAYSSADGSALASRLTTAESSITQQAGEIALRVTQTTYEGGLATKEDGIYKQNTAPAHALGRLWLDTSKTPNILNRSTGSAWVKVTPTTAGEVGAYPSSDGSALAGRVTSAESAITQNASEILLRVSKESLSSEIRQRASDVRIAVGQVGGKNLLKKSNVVVTSAAYQIGNWLLSEAPLLDEEVTLSIKGTLGADRQYFGIYNSGGSVECATIHRTDLGSDGVFRKTFKWKIGASLNTHLTIYQMLNTAISSSTIQWVQLERGGIATDWTPAISEMKTMTATFDDGGLVLDKGAFRQKDDGGVEFEIVSKTNLVHDHSFELLTPSGSVGVHDDFPINAPINQGVSFTGWLKQGDPRLISDYNRSSFSHAAIFGLQAVACTSANQLIRYFFVKPNTTYTISSYAYPHYSRNAFNSTVRSYFWLAFYNSNVVHLSSLSSAETLTTAFSVNNNQKLSMKRHTYTFTTPSTATIIGIVLGSPTTTEWVVYDGVQVVEGTRPVYYESEDNLWAMARGEGYGGVSMVNPTIGGNPIWSDGNVQFQTSTNGGYIRYPNRLQICWHNLSISTVTATYNESTVWWFPASFSGAPTYQSASLMASRFGSDIIQLRIMHNTQHNATLGILANQTTNNVMIGLLAIGRW